MTKQEPIELTRACLPGEKVFWRTLGGNIFVGTLKAWDNGTAIVMMENGREKAVRCDA